MPFAVVTWAFKDVITSTKLAQMVENIITHDHRLDGSRGAKLMDLAGAGLDGQTPPAGAVPILKSGLTAAATTGASGVLPQQSFPTAFPNGLHALMLTTSAGTAVAAVVNGSGTNDKNGFSAAFNGANNVAGVRVSYVAVGW